MKLAMRIATGTVLSLALVSVPASARSYRGHHGYHHRHHGGGIGTLGGILLGAAVLGTAAAIASDNRRERYQPRYEPQPYGGNTGYRSYDDEYGRNDPRAVPPAAYDDGDRGARAVVDGVAGIDRVDQIDGGAIVRGRVQVENGRAAPVRAMSFSCSASYGEVRSLRLG